MIALALARYPEGATAEQIAYVTGLPEERVEQVLSAMVRDGRAFSHIRVPRSGAVIVYRAPENV